MDRHYVDLTSCVAVVITNPEEDVKTRLDIHVHTDASSNHLYGVKKCALDRALAKLPSALQQKGIVLREGMAFQFGKVEEVESNELDESES